MIGAQLERRKHGLVVALAGVVFVGLALVMWVTSGPSLALVLVGVGAGVVLLLAVQARLYVNVLTRLHELERGREKTTWALYRQLEALSSVRSFLPDGAQLPPMREGAVSPDFASLLISEVLRRRPKLVLELGSGVSTLLLGHALSRLEGGRLVSLDHEEKFRGQTAENVALHGLASVVDVRLAALKPVEIDGRSWPWYDSAAVADLEDVDMVVVDGPPVSTGELARFPALPVLEPILSAHAVLLLDDTDREDEKRILELWRSSRDGVEIEEVHCEKGAAIVTLGSTGGG
ncbi:MAG: class I SAM-dependent methyltransferase [Planctomycetota bacterium]